MSQQPDYKFKIYPSLLDAYQRYLSTTEENYFFQDENGKWHCNYDGNTGEYQYSPLEVEELIRKELIDKINRVRTYSQSASKGTVFNELVDCVIAHKKSDTISTNRVYDAEGKLVAIEATIDNDGCVDVFQFDANLLASAGKYFNKCLSQVYVEAPLETKYGTVLLYGYVDELNADMVYDIKTTNSYQFGKYEHYWQRHLYPYCLEESGLVTGIKGFEFTCYVLSGGSSRNPIIYGKQYPEFYNFNFNRSKELLTHHCERFIEFLEQNREFITDEKVFGGEKCISQSA